ncbi:unnamed protein product [Tetraodon nigroviridis]|uniref:Chromosome 4 SCAF13767, whole genome shotgun sequence n=1 Tax=Tetraodon nigroviridis TaxID=99883 RepID=Q4SVC1_TETNG|nr:unnamed protein product [Tetraodon nigroviridis]
MTVDGGFHIDDEECAREQLPIEGQPIDLIQVKSDV